MPISIVLVLVRKCIANKLIFEVFDIPSAVPNIPSHCSLLWYRKGIVYQPLYKVLCTSVFRLLSYRDMHDVCAEAFLWFVKEEVFTRMYITMPIFCMPPNSITLLRFRHWSIPIEQF